MNEQQKNVLGADLEACGHDPMTGFYRDGCCNTGPGDVGTHTVCSIMTDDFLEFSKSKGNDLSSPKPEFGFLDYGQEISGACVRSGGKKPVKLARPPV